MNKAIKQIGITYIISWLFWICEIILISCTNLTRESLLCIILYYLGFIAPIVLIFFYKSENLLKKFITLKKGSLFFILAFLVLQVIVLSQGATSLKETTEGPKAFILSTFLKLLILKGPVELVWRNLIFESLSEDKSTLVASSIIISITQLFLHLPLWFITASAYQNTSFIIFALFILLLNIWLCSLYSISSNVLLCMLISAWTYTLGSIWNYQFTIILILGLMFLTFLTVDCALVIQKKDHS